MVVVDDGKRVDLMSRGEGGLAPLHLPISLHYKPQPKQYLDGPLDLGRLDLGVQLVRDPFAVESKVGSSGHLANCGIIPMRQVLEDIRLDTPRLAKSPRCADALEAVGAVFAVLWR